MKLNSLVTHSKKMLIVGPTIIVVASGFGTVFAAAAGGSIPATNGTITGCYPTVGPIKPLSLIDTSTAATCPPGQTEVTFNQTGPQGPAGATGQTGPAGPQGAAGAPGATGPQARPALRARRALRAPPGRRGRQAQQETAPRRQRRTSWAVSRSTSPEVATRRTSILST